MYEEPRQLFLTFHIDTNRINSRRGLENMNKLEHWLDKGLILLYMSRVAHEEAGADGDPLRARKAMMSIFSLTMARTNDERARLGTIEAILFPSGARTQNERNDVEIAFNAGKYGAILVTADGDLLRHRGELEQLGIRVMTDHEAVELIEQRIVERDERASRIATATTGSIPNWVGKDSLATFSTVSGGDTP